jgi:effector-binding domain-containing protein
MRFLKIFLMVVLAIVAAYLVFCILGPKDFNTSRSVTVAASPAAVFEEISDFSRWQAWSPWANRDTAMVNSYSGEPGAVGHQQTWESKTEGSGTQNIEEIRPNEFLRTKLVFKDWDQPSFSNWILEPAGDSTKVTWTMEGGELPFMLRGLMMIMGAKGSIEADYEKGLASLKQVAEAKPKLSYEIIDIPDTWFLGKRMKLNMKDTDSALFANTYGELIAAIGGPQNIAGMPFAIGHEVNMTTGDMDLEIAIPVASQIPNPPAGMASGVIPAGRCLKYVYVGSYEGTGAAWTPFMDATMSTYKPRWAGYEVYANDPGEVGYDSSKYITWLMQPIE